MDGALDTEQSAFKQAVDASQSFDYILNNENCAKRNQIWWDKLHISSVSFFKSYPFCHYMH